MTRSTRITLAAAALSLLGATTVAEAGPPKGAAGKASPAARGQQLIAKGGCNDCHTPLKLGQNGPEPDLARLLSGHPEGLQMPPAPRLPPGPWAYVGSATMTAWSGPWGVSFTANLTPDPETGLGRWTEAQFIQAMRTGRHMGSGRPILPPMPVATAQAMSDGELRDMFAYLRSIPAIRNRVPDPIPPAEVDAAAAPAR